MTITPINQFFSTENTSLKKSEQSARNKADALISASPASRGADVNASATPQSRDKATEYRQASRDIFSAAAELNATQDSLGEVKEKLARMKSIAATVNNGNDSKTLRAEFEQLGADILKITGRTSFAALSEFDDEGADVAPDPSFLSSLNLGDETVSQQLTTFDDALQRVSSTVDAVLSEIEINAALYEISAQNQEAARAAIPQDGDSLVDALLAATPQATSVQAARLDAETLNLLQG
jgi:uncharacterized membrane protein YkoI